MLETRFGVSDFDQVAAALLQQVSKDAVKSYSPVEFTVHEPV
jgi:hypothetical protein